MEIEGMNTSKELLRGVIKKCLPYNDEEDTLLKCWEQYKNNGVCRQILFPTNDFIPIIDGLLKEIERLNQASMEILK